MTSTAKLFAGGFLVAVATLVVALEVGGGAPQPPVPGLPDAGPFVGWLLPVAGLIVRCAALCVIGFLTAAAFLLPNRSDNVEGLSVVAATRASVAAWVWAGSSLVLFLFTVADVFGRPLRDLSPVFVWTFATDTSSGRALLLQAAAAAVLAFACRWTVSVRWLSVWTGVAVAALLPVSLTGHTASAGAHDLATVSLFVHVASASVWVGGLAALIWVAFRGSKRLPAALQRYSALAGWCFAIVGVAGIINASVRLIRWSDLIDTRYGHLIVAKLAALIVLGLWAARLRQQVAREPDRFRVLAGVELFVMAATVGLGVALSRTPTPASDVTVTPAEELLGGPLPPPPTFGRVLWGWEPTGVALAVVLFGAALYLTGLLVMRRRGDAWPRGRTLSWFAGLLVVAWAGVGGLSKYAHVMFSAHMGSHMMLGMVAPILLVLGAPVTLALRTLPGPREPGEVSPRGLLLSFLHSPFARVVTHPLVGPALFVGSLFGLYFTGLFTSLMESHWGHGAMQLHFLAVGSLYYYVLIGVDPSPRTLPPIARFGILMLTIPFHAFFSVALMSSKSVIAGPYWAIINRPYDTNLLADQYLGGGISWAMGEVPLVLVFGALFVQWIRADVREARRRDRAADRDGDAELAAYNARLKELAEKGKRREP